MRIGALVADCSLDMVGRHLDELSAAAALLPSGTRVSIGATDAESIEVHRATSAAVAAAGLSPVPHLAARRIGSAAELDHVLSGLQHDGTAARILALAGDPDPAIGPYESTLDLIRAGRLAAHGVRAVGVAGHPEGHPAVSDDVLWSALGAKLDELERQGMSAEISTQMVLSADPVIAWIDAVRDRGITVPIRIGLCGPIEPARLAGYARRVGAAASPEILHRYGVAPGPGRVGPERLVADLAQRLDPTVHGDVRLHLFSLGGLRVAAEWIRDAAA